MIVSVGQKNHKKSTTFIETQIPNVVSSCQRPTQAPLCNAYFLLKEISKSLLAYVYNMIFLHQSGNVTDSHCSIMGLALAVLLLFFTALRLLTGGGVVGHLLQWSVCLFNAEFSQFFS